MINKWIATTFLIAFTQYGHCQTWVEKTRVALPKMDELTEAITYKPTDANFLFYSDSCSLFEHVVQSFFAKSKTKKQYKIKNSSLLNELTKHAVLELSINRARKSSRHHAYLRKLGRALIGTNKTYSLIEFIVFDIPVVKVPSSYFYTVENGESPYHLYKGKAPSKKEIEEGDAKFIPCDLYTEKQLAKKIESKIRSSRIYTHLLNQEVSTFGVSAVPNRKTVYRKGIPTIRVFVIVGIKRVNEKKLNSGHYRTQLKREKRKTEKEIKKISRILKRSIGIFFNQ